MLPMPDGTMRTFTASAAIWQAMKFLVVVGRWSENELVALAEQSYNSQVDLSGALPTAHGQPGPVSILELEMLKKPPLSRALIRPVEAGEGESLSLDACLRNAVSRLYSELQNRLG